MKIKTLVLTALAVPMIASAQPSTQTKPSPSPSTDKSMNDKSNDKSMNDKSKTVEKTAKLSNDEVAIVAHLHAVNRMEIDLAHQAKVRATQAVKRYADTLLDDHSSADKDLLAMAKKKGLAKIPADTPKTEAEKQEHKDMMQSMAALKKLKGADFDREYLRMMVDGHEKELAKSDVLAATANDSDLKTTIEARKTVLQRHIDAAKELQKGNAQASK